MPSSLSDYKAPKAIHLRNELPRPAIGKVGRKATAAEARGGAGG